MIIKEVLHLNIVGYQFAINIAEVVIGIWCKYRLTLDKCKAYITNITPQIIIRSDAKRYADEHPEKNYETMWRNKKNELVWVDPEIKEFLEIRDKIAEVMIGKGFLLMHGAAVAKNGKAYIFTAPSGTGKTTRIRFWMRLYPDSVIVNGDKPMIHLSGKSVLACGIPWAGKEGWNCNIQVPIQAIYLLERSEEDCVKEISFAKAFCMLLQQTYTPKVPENDRKRIQMLKMMEGKLRLFRFRSTMTAESVQMAYEAAQAAGPIQ